MTEDATPARTPVARNVFEMEDEKEDSNTANDATDDPAAMEEADEIT